MLTMFGVITKRYNTCLENKQDILHTCQCKHLHNQDIPPGKIVIDEVMYNLGVNGYVDNPIYKQHRVKRTFSIYIHAKQA